MNQPASDKIETEQQPSTGAVLLRFLMPVILLVLGVIGYVLLSKAPPPPKRPPAPPRVLRTTVEELTLQDYTTMMETQGVVRPYYEATLTAQVSGQVVEVLPTFEDGAFFNEGDVLIRLDDTDYQTAVISAEAQVARAKAAYAQEEARAKQARLNWEDLGYTEEPNDLVLRLPQLNEAQANVKSAEAQLERAIRDLDRTKVRAPFDGRVRLREVGLGQSVGTGTSLGSVYSVDFAEVRLPIDMRQRRYLELPEDHDDAPVPVTLRDALDEESTLTWEGNIVRTEGVLDESSLSLYAIARIDDPFGRKTNAKPLRIGQPVKGVIQGKELKQVYVVPRRAVRQVDRLYLVDKNELTLDRRTIETIWTDKTHVIIRDPEIPNGSWIATSQLTYSPNLTKVEIIESTPVAEETAAGETAAKPTKTEGT